VEVDLWDEAFFAVVERDIPKLERLKADGYDLNQRDRFARSLRDVAQFYEFCDVDMALREMGVLDVPDGFFSSDEVTQAVRAQDLEQVESLLARHLNPDQLGDFYGSPFVVGLIIASAKSGGDALLAQIADRQPRFDLFWSGGQEALTEIIARASSDTIQQLISPEALPELSGQLDRFSRERAAILDAALRRGDVGTLEYLNRNFLKMADHGGLQVHSGHHNSVPAHIGMNPSREGRKATWTWLRETGLDAGIAGPHVFEQISKQTDADYASEVLNDWRARLPNVSVALPPEAQANQLPSSAAKTSTVTPTSGQPKAASETERGHTSASSPAASASDTPTTRIVRIVGDFDANNLPAPSLQTPVTTSAFIIEGVIRQFKDYFTDWEADYSLRFPGRPERFVLGKHAPGWQYLDPKEVALEWLLEGKYLMVRWTEFADGTGHITTDCRLILAPDQTGAWREKLRSGELVYSRSGSTYRYSGQQNIQYDSKEKIFIFTSSSMSATADVAGRRFPQPFSPMYDFIRKDGYGEEHIKHRVVSHYKDTGEAIEFLDGKSWLIEEEGTPLIDIGSYLEKSLAEMRDLNPDLKGIYCEGDILVSTDVKPRER